jgi:cytosine/adenosine deaminase-related metal-dependent hydrolase
VLVTGLHLDQGYCVRFPPADGARTDDEDEPLETWEDWDELDFLAAEGTVERGGTLPASVLTEAREVLDDAEDGCHLHLHESDED